MTVKVASFAPVQPLARFYAKEKARLPVIDVIAGEEMPEPYRGLLVHNGDMTPTLERFYKDGIHLRVLSCETDGGEYTRNVILLTNKGGRPIEFGAIRIDLGLFPARGRKLIVEGRQPLGGILRDLAMEHRSSPKAYFKLNADRAIRQAFQIKGKHVLYGRCNTLWDKKDRPLAEIVEILPPA
ncbi:MAG: hypothetical protein KIS92_19125 [Planctomycetota bacterium]|nr:hypothetical protein [Planctomycetota bacterium]